MTLIEHLNGRVFDFDDAEIRTSNFIIQSPNYDNRFSDLEGKNGLEDSGSFLKGRKITAYFTSKASSNQTSSLLRDEIFEMLRSNKPFYITEKRSTNKRWLVKVESPYEVPTDRFLGKFSVSFIALKGLAESRKTTLDVNREGLLNDDSWAYGMGLETTDDSELVYIHAGKSFKIFNAGNFEELHPFENYLKIEIRNVVGSSSKFSLVNRTNNTRFTIKEPIKNTDVWLIDGPVIKKNSLAAAKFTNKTFISLVPGWNQFEILDATSAQVSFDFRYLYL